ncbi:MAG: nitrate/nitrite transporter NrtS [Candidatus Puniceispirillaceae bacterium]
MSKKILMNSVKTAIFVGTILALINHGDLIKSGELTPECVMKMGLTCLVP